MATGFGPAVALGAEAASGKSAPEVRASSFAWASDRFVARAPWPLSMRVLEPVTPPLGAGAAAGGVTWGWDGEIACGAGPGRAGVFTLMGAGGGSGVLRNQTTPIAPRTRIRTDPPKTILAPFNLRRRRTGGGGGAETASSSIKSARMWIGRLLPGLEGATTGKGGGSLTSSRGCSFGPGAGAKRTSGNSSNVGSWSAGAIGSAGGADGGGLGASTGGGGTGAAAVADNDLSRSLGASADAAVAPGNVFGAGAAGSSLAGAAGSGTTGTS